MAQVASSINTLGIITATAGTPVQLSSSVIKCNRIWIQPLKAFGASGDVDTNNTGMVYLLNTLTAKGASSANVIARLAPEENAIMLEAPVQYGFDLSAFWLDVQTTADGALISYA